MLTTQLSLSPATAADYWEIFLKPWRHPPSVLSLFCGCLLFYWIQELGRSLGRKSSQLKSKSKIESIENEIDNDIAMKVKERKEIEKIDKFGNVLMSLVHCFVVLPASFAYILSSDPVIVESNKSLQLSYFLTFWLKFTVILSQSYIIIDSLTYIRQYFYLMENRVMLIHHICIILANFPGVLLVYDSVPYEGLFIVASCFVAELSTIFLNMRYFAIYFDIPNLYLYSGIGLLITYPLTRTIWYSYVLYFTYSSTLEITYCPTMKTIALFSETFIVLMSLAYFFILLKSGKKLFILKVSSNKVVIRETEQSPYEDIESFRNKPKKDRDE